MVAVVLDLGEDSFSDLAEHSAMGYSIDRASYNHNAGQDDTYLERGTAIHPQWDQTSAVLHHPLGNAMSNLCSSPEEKADQPVDLK